jgi:hypothetical protein
MKTKAAEEFCSRQSQDFFLIVMPVIASLERNPVAVETGDPVIADGHIVSIFARLFQS